MPVVSQHFHRKSLLSKVTRLNYLSSLLPNAILRLALDLHLVLIAARAASLLVPHKSYHADRLIAVLLGCTQHIIDDLLVVLIHALLVSHSSTEECLSLSPAVLSF